MMRKSPERRGFIARIAAMLALPYAAPRLAFAQADPLDALVRKVTGGASVGRDRVKLETPLLADNGHSVPLKVTVQSPMTQTDFVRSITILSERNPRPVIARFQLGPRAGRAQIVTRVRLNGAQHVVAVAEMSDGSFWSDTAEVVVTESACLDQS